MRVGERGKERSDTRGSDLSARDSIHSTTLGSVCIANRLVRQEMSRTPSCTMQYFHLMGQLVRTNYAGEARAMCRKTLLGYSRRFWRLNLHENTRTPYHH